MKKSSLACILTVCILLSSCYANQHVIGQGDQGRGKAKFKQWYALYGLIELGESPDIQSVVGDRKDYTIQTKISFVDFLIGIPTSAVTIVPRSVKVKY